jgi:phosphatidylglycerophosphate synthase
VTTPRPTHLDAFSAPHALLMLLALGVAVASGRAVWIALAALLSFARLIWLARGSFAQLRAFGAGNLVTSVRVLSLFGLALSFDAGLPLWAAGWALWIFTLDGIDGALARRLGTTTLFGALYDMESDACFVLLLACGLLELGRAGAWVLVAGSLRYVYVLALHVTGRQHAEAPRMNLGRYVFAIVVVSFTLALWPAAPLSSAIAAAATLLLSYSFFRSFQASFAAANASPRGTG